MRAAVVSDKIERTITIGIVDGPDLDISPEWFTKRRVIRVDQAIIWVRDDEPRLMAVSGGLIRLDGKVSKAQRFQHKWSLYAVPGAPRWARTLFSQAPKGITEWQHEEDD